MITEITSHVFLELLNDLGYVFIAGRFLIAFHYAECKRERNSCLFLVFIFVFCGITRLVMLSNSVEEVVHAENVMNLHTWLMVFMNIFTWGFVITDKPKAIVNGLKDA